MRRREFLGVLGGAAAWPLAARGQQAEGIRRLAVLSPLSPGDLDNQSRHAAFLEALRQLGWTDGRNLRVEARHSAGDPAVTRKYAAELVALAPDVILATGGAGAAAMLQATRSVPIVFVVVPDPVGSGFVESLAQPGGNATGFMMFEYDLSAKWLELLKEIAPNVTHAAVLRDAAIAAGIGQFAVIQSVARSVGVDVRAINLSNAAEIERSVTAFARVPNGGLILTASALSAVHRDLIISLAARFRLPMTYHERSYVAAGGLVSYGANFVDQYRRAAGYVDRILKGVKPADLPVQAPTKYDLTINLKTAKALGLTRTADAARPRRRGDRITARCRAIDAVDGSSTRHVSAMDVGAVKAPTIQRSYPCKQSRQSVSTSPSRSFRSTALMLPARWSSAAS